MALSINWATKVITVPQADLTPTGGSNYSLNTAQFKHSLRDLEDNEAGVTFLPILNHNTEVVLGGITYARQIEIINGYTITFQDVGSPYRVYLAGSNNNIMDVVNLNNVSVASSNSAGLVVSGSGVTAQDKTDIAQLSRDEVMGVSLEGEVTLAQMLRLLAAVHAGNIVRSGNNYSIQAVNAAPRERIAGTVDTSGNRVITNLDVTP